MRVNVAIPESHVTAPVLDAALEAVTTLNEALIKSGDAPTFKQALPHVQWRPEPPGAEHFDNASIVSERGWGDCDDLAPHHAASLRVSGEDRGARAIVVPSGPQKWHAVVRRSDGRIEDPSEAAGMNGTRNPHAISGAALPLMCAPQVNSVSGAYELRPQIALRPMPNGNWQGRTDLPWNWKPKPGAKAEPGELAMAALHQAPLPSTALCGAIDGAIELGEVCGAADPDHLERLRCLSDYAAGMPLHDLAQAYGHEHARAAHAVVGSFWSHIKSIAKPLTKVVTSPFTTPFNLAKDLSHGDLKGAFGHVMSPLQATAQLAHPLAHQLAPFSNMLRMVPGVGPMAASAIDIADHGIPTNFNDLARMAMQQGMGFIPGVGPVMSAMQNNPFAQMAQSIPGMPGGGGWPTMSFH